MVLRLRYRIGSAHVHCRVFTALAENMTFAKSGDLVFRLDEWNTIRNLCQSPDGRANGLESFRVHLDPALVVEFVPEDFYDDFSPVTC